MAQPNEFRIERSMTIDATAEDVRAWIVELRHWQEWSPWEGLDEHLQREYSTPSAGPGATYAWRGNRRAGQGRMEIVDATDPTTVTLELWFLKPFKAHNRVVFSLDETDGRTTVRWTMTGPKSVVSRVLGVVLNMEKLVGKDFEKGLAALRARAETGPPPAA